MKVDRVIAFEVAHLLVLNISMHKPKVRISSLRARCFESV